MATLAHVYSRVFSNGAARGSASQRGALPRMKATVPVRAFANEDIYFFVKRIDNSRVVRQADPQAGGGCRNMIRSLGAAPLLLIRVLPPHPPALLAAYQNPALQ